MDGNRTRRPRLRDRALVFIIVVSMAGIPAVALASGWIDALFRPRGPSSDGNDVTAIVETLKRERPEAGRIALAAAASAEGHWTFWNASGEAFTAATADELRRAVTSLAPQDPVGASDKTKPSLPLLTLHLTSDSVFRFAASLSLLPRDAELRIRAGGASFRVARSTAGGKTGLYVLVAPRLAVLAKDRPSFDEALALLERPVAARRLRLVALQPGGPTQLRSTPVMDPATQRAEIDAIEPDRLRHSLGAVNGQTVVVAGRVAGPLLYFQGDLGPERSLLVADIVAAAAEADLDLLMLRADSALQPGSRNWLWLKADIANLDLAVKRETLRDFLATIAGEGRVLGVDVVSTTMERTALELRLVSDLPGSTAPGLTDAIGDLAAGVAGRVSAVGVDAFLRSSDRERELAWRLIPGVSSQAQLAYLLALIAGLLGHRAASAWWRRLWPRELGGDYGVRAGYWSAIAIRWCVFALIFLPLSGPAALVATLATLARQRSLRPSPGA